MIKRDYIQREATFKYSLIITQFSKSNTKILIFLKYNLFMHGFTTYDCKYFPAMFSESQNKDVYVLNH